MALRHEHAEVIHEPVEETAVHQPFGVAQAVSFAVGIANVVLGGIGLARTGVRDLTGETASVAGLEMTGLLALIHLGIGLLALIGATSRPGAASACATVGALFIAGGIIALVQSIGAFGWDNANGVAYLIMGGVALLAGLATRDAAIVRRSVVHGH